MLHVCSALVVGRNVCTSSRLLQSAVNIRFGRTPRPEAPELSPVSSVHTKKHIMPCCLFFKETYSATRIKNVRIVRFQFMCVFGDILAALWDSAAVTFHTEGIDQTEPTAIDASCAADGGSDQTAKKLESKAKNNFCATDPPVTITPRPCLPFSEKSTRTARSRRILKTVGIALKDLVKVGSGRVGEGTSVRLVAYLLEAHFPKSNVKKGELVNCKAKGEENNDIHIALVANPNEDDICNSFTAEMSPHFRPETWRDVVDLNLGNRPVRVAGAVFFDGSHQPCTAAKKTSSPRASAWEIHPVYGFDICRFRTKGKCKATDEAVWIPLHEWHATKTPVRNTNCPWTMPRDVMSSRYRASKKILDVLVGQKGW